jgi:dienelactone hydrolase
MFSTDATRLELLRLLGVGPLGDNRATRVVRGPRERLGRIWLERVELWADDGHVVPCLYLTPDDEQAGPGVGAVAVHQHAGQYSWGKSEPAGITGDPGKAYARELAEAGIPTIVPDLLGFEERQRAGDDPQQAEQLDAWMRVAKGRPLQGLHTEDVGLATSWLHEQGLTTLGIVGHSLGGQVALFNLACDSRLQAGVISCGVGTLESFERERIHHNPAWFVPGLQAAGDARLLIEATADQRLMVVAGRNDPLFPFADVERLAEELPTGSEFVSFDGGHDFPAPERGAALRWLRGRPLAGD